MTTLLTYIQVALSILLVTGVLLQRSEAGLGSGFGGSDSGSMRYTRRGFEKLLFNSTLVIAVLFMLTSLATLFFRS